MSVNSINIGKDSLGGDVFLTCFQACQYFVVNTTLIKRSSRKEKLFGKKRVLIFKPARKSINGRRQGRMHAITHKGKLRVKATVSPTS